MFRCVRALAVALLLFPVLAIPAQAASPAPRFSGSFVQPSKIDAWSDTTLKAELDRLKGSGMTEQVLQWTAESDQQSAVRTMYPSAVAGFKQASATDVIGRLLGSAEVAGVSEYLGLQMTGQWWTKHATDQAWLDKEAAISGQLARDLYDRYKSKKSFVGWYVPFEVDNVNFTDAPSQQRLVTFLASIVSQLRAIDKTKPIVISPYFQANQGMSPAAWRSMWKSILETADFNAIALQDGMGAGHATLADLPTWFDATAGAIADAKATKPTLTTTLWADTETFQAGYTPMPVQTIAADMAAVASRVTKFWSFSWDHYTSPYSVAPAYDNAFRNYLATGAADKDAPTTPGNLTAGVLSPQMARFTWTAPTDKFGVAGVRVLADGLVVGRADTLAVDPRVTIRSTASTPTSLVVDGLQPGKTYQVTVVAFDGSGNSSAPSASVALKMPDAPATTVSLSSGRPYTASLAPSASYPDGGGELTDGRVATANYWDAAWQGRVAAIPFTITVDLGSAQRVDQVSSRWLRDSATGILLPKAVSVAVSGDGVSWVSVGASSGAASSASAPAVSTYTVYPPSGTMARYVRLTVSPSMNGWLFTDEVDVRRA